MGAAHDADQPDDPGAGGEGLFGGRAVVSKRRLSPARRAAYWLLAPLFAAFIRILWSSCRVRVVGEENGEEVLASGRPFVPCLWHEHLLFSLWYLKRMHDRGAEIAVLISPSVDGELFTWVTERFGVRVVRGSATRTGARAFRGLYQVLVEEGISPVSTPDGPQGPRHGFKKGAVKLASKSSAPLLPLAYDARWKLRLPTWDRMILPLPFSRVVVAVGAPRAIPAELAGEALQVELDGAASALHACARTAGAALG